MAYAICTKCGQEFHWRAWKGSSVKRISSSCCNAPARGKTPAEKQGLENVVLPIIQYQEWIPRHTESPRWGNLRKTRAWIDAKDHTIHFTTTWGGFQLTIQPHNDWVVVEFDWGDERTPMMTRVRFNLKDFLRLPVVRSVRT